MNMEFKRKLPGPQDIINMYPISEKLRAQKEKNDEEIQKVFRGKSDKFILVIGPCSADREDAVLDYIARLRRVQEQVSDKIIIIPRTPISFSYHVRFEKNPKPLLFPETFSYEFSLLYDS